MSKIGIALFACFFSVACPAQWKSDTLGGMLNAYLDLLAGSCPKHAAAAADAKARGDIGAIVVTRQQYQAMCVCHPAKTRELLKSLPQAKLSAQAVGENTFGVYATAGIQEPCVAEQLHAMFEGKSCDGFKMTEIKKGIEEAAFCACMKKVVAGWSDADAPKLFREIGPYNTQFRSAKANKLPRPKRTPLVDRYIDSLSQCGGGDEFKE